MAFISKVTRCGIRKLCLKKDCLRVTIATFYNSASKNREATLTNDELLCLDPVQLKLLEEECIIVNENDKPLRSGSKKECHLMENINAGLVHRAFSVFLFNMKGELLIQQRSDAKITFPGYFTNTCCSHPLYNDNEMEEKNAIGVKRAAQRRLEIELGVNPKELGIEDLTYLTRIQYKAPSSGRWGESEIDYILVAQKDIQLNPNPNEVKTCLYVNKSDFTSFLESVKNDGHKFTPWFLLIANSFLQSLWGNLHNLQALTDHKTIHRM